MVDERILHAQGMTVADAVNHWLSLGGQRGNTARNAHRKIGSDVVSDLGGQIVYR